MITKKYSNVILIFLFWFLVGLFIGAQNYIYAHSKGLNCTLIGTMLDQVPNFIFWGIYTPFILWLVKKSPFDEKLILKRSIVVHFTAACVISSFHIFIFALLQFLLSGGQKGRSFFSLFMDLFNNWFFFQFFFYGGVLVFGSALNYYRKFREKEAATLQLEKLLAEAKLSSLKMQLHPHFLFNTMNNISMLVRQNKNDEAIKTITLLGDLLRHVLLHKEAKLIYLKDEMELTKKYLRIEKIRFDGRLTFQIEVDKQIENCLIPDLITQPIVENSIRHGIEDKIDDALIKITAIKNGNEISIIIEDNGGGCDKLDVFYKSNGYGIKLTKERIEKMYGSKGKLVIDSKYNLYTKVVITLPVILE